jgi:hypothetical protein
MWGECEVSIKIERMPMPDMRKQRTNIDEFCEALLKLKLGESFSYPGVSSYHRLGLSWAQTLLKRRFSIKGGRVWRVA